MILVYLKSLSNAKVILGNSCWRLWHRRNYFDHVECDLLTFEMVLLKDVNQDYDQLQLVVVFKATLKQLCLKTSIKEQ